MNTDQVFQFLELLASEPSKNAKVELLEEFLEDETFKKVCQYAYNPHQNYGVLKFDMPSVVLEDGIFEGGSWNLLDKLAARDLTGGLALELIQLHMLLLSADSQSLFLRILKKDLRGGFTAKSLNKACPGLIREFPYMRCSTMVEVPLDKIDWSDGLYSQEKADGMFVNIDKVDDDSPLMITTRRGHRLLIVVREPLSVGYQYHGEALVVNSMGLVHDRKTGNGILNRLLKGNEEALAEGEYVTFKVWDMVQLNAPLSAMPYIVRYDQLVTATKQCADISVISTFQVFNKTDAESHCRDIIEAGGEGTVLKMKHGFWKNGTSREQVKLKAERDCELLVVGMKEGQGKYAGTLGAMLCESSEGILKVSVSGFTDEERDAFWENKLSSEPMIITVRFNETIIDKQKNWSLFLPRYVEVRHDKTEADNFETIHAL